jgi:hypothetical protein
MHEVAKNFIQPFNKNDLEERKISCPSHDPNPVLSSL